MNNNKILVLLLLSMFFFTACGSKEEASLNPDLPLIAPKGVTDVVKKSDEPPLYVYKGFNNRDPFVPLTGQGFVMRGNQGVTIPNIDSLILKGIVNDGKQKLAILSSGGISYMLKGSDLYDNRRRLVEGVTGAIKSDSVIMIDANKKTREIKIREK